MEKNQDTDGKEMSGWLFAGIKLLKLKKKEEKPREFGLRKNKSRWVLNTRKKQSQ